jgi:hypothetical protein
VSDLFERAVQEPVNLQVPKGGRRGASCASSWRGEPSGTPAFLSAPLSSADVLVIQQTHSGNTGAQESSHSGLRPGLCLLPLITALFIFLLALISYLWIKQDASDCHRQLRTFFLLTLVGILCGNHEGGEIRYA